MIKPNLKKTACIIAAALAAWTVMLAVDFLRANTLNKPIFVIPAQTSDDGGSGKYVGLGYSFHIKGNFLPEDENKGVTSVKGYLFGQCVVDKKR